MAASVVEAVSAKAVGATATVTTASTTAVGDILVLVHALDYYSPTVMTTPTGTSGTWTLRSTGSLNDTSPSLKLWTRPVTVAGAQTVNATHTSDTTNYATVIVVRGASGTVDAAAGSGAETNMPTAPSVSGAADGVLVCGWCSGPDAAGTYSPPLGMTERSDMQEAPYSAFTTATQGLTLTAATGTKQSLFTGSTRYASGSIALAPVVASLQTLSPTGVATGQAFGAAVVSYTAKPTGIGSAQAFGTPSLAMSMRPAGVGSSEPFGSATLTQSAFLTVPSITTGEAVGNAALTRGVASILPGQIGPTLAIGTPAVSAGPATLSPLGANSTEGFGLPAIELRKMVVVGIESGSIVGFAAVAPGARAVGPLGIAGAVAVGAPLFDRDDELQWRLIMPSRTDVYGLLGERGPRFSIATELTVFGSDDGLVSKETPSTDILADAKYVWLGGYVHTTRSVPVMELWVASGFEVELCAEPDA